MQSVYSTVPADWAMLQNILFVCLVGRLSPTPLQRGRVVHIDAVKSNEMQFLLINTNTNKQDFKMLYFLNSEKLFSYTRCLH